MKILLAVDPTIPHEDLLQQVTSRVWPSPCTFSVVAVIEPIRDPLFPETITEYMANVAGQAEKKTELIASCLRASGLEAQPFVLEGDPHDLILQEARVLGIDLILLGAPRRDDAFPFLSSRVARAVLRHATCSVQIVRTGDVRRVLVPTDGSDHSVATAKAIAARPWNSETQFEVMSVVEPLSPSISFLYPPHNESAEAVALRAEAAGRAMTGIRMTEQILSSAGLKISDHVIVPIDSPQKLIIGEAANWRADLIIVGCHGRRGISRLLIGSVSESVAIHSICSVEVIR